MKFKGIAASNGIAIAKVFKINEESIVVKKTIISDYKNQIKLFNQVLKQVKVELENLYKMTLKKLGEEKAKIFQAHQEILNDQVIIEEIHHLIKEEKVSSAYAVFSIFSKYIKMFETMEEEYFRERASDVKDVSSRIIKKLLGIKSYDLTMINEEVIIVSDDLTPSQTAQLNLKFVKGFLCNIGGRTSHSAIMARSLEIPAILGLKNITEKVENGDLLIIDGELGNVIIKPSAEEVKLWKQKQKMYLQNLQDLQQYKNKPSISLDGFKVTLEANIGSISDIKYALKYGAEGVGLFRSEFLYMDNNNWPTEEEQYLVYKQVLESFALNMVVIRTLDIGGDKHLSYYKFDKEMNPFLGYRAIRLSLNEIEVFKTQIKALLRASVYGKLAIMFPMIATIEEFQKAKSIVIECQEALKKAKIAFSDNIQIGMMVEVPSAAVLSNVFTKYADFVSIGTNDLLQYSFAADRMSQKVAYLYQPFNPALLKLLQTTIVGAHQNKKWAGMCGEMAGDMLAIPLLLGLGLDYFSMSASSLLRVKKLINNLNKSECEFLVEKALMCESQKQVKALVQKFLETKKLI